MEIRVYMFFLLLS